MSDDATPTRRRHDRGEDAPAVPQEPIPPATLAALRKADADLVAAQQAAIAHNQRAAALERAVIACEAVFEYVTQEAARMLMLGPGEKLDIAEGIVRRRQGVE